MPIAVERFTGKERDEETGLDYFGARYFSGVQGRFTGPDAPFADQKETDPQSWNLYAYVRNKPLSYRDPDGRALDTILDIGFIAYDLYVIATEGATETNVAALGADVVGAFIPFATGGGTAIRIAKAADKMADGGKVASKVNEVREGAKAAENTAKNADNVAKGKSGIYAFPDQTTGGKTYVGQSGDLDKRLGNHESTGRLKPGTETKMEVAGDKTGREVAEHNRIQEIPGGNPASRSDAVSNKVDLIGPKRQHLLDKE